MFLAKQIILSAIVVLCTIVSTGIAVGVIGRSSAACVYLKPKIYCYGGRQYRRDDSGQLALAGNLFNSLDISESTDIITLQRNWESIPHEEPGPNFDSATVAVPEYNAIFMDGGAGKDDNNGIKAKYNTTIYTITDGKWETNITTGHLDGQAHSAILGPHNIIYVWGGASYPDYTSLQDPVEYPLEMYLYHLETSTWSTGPAVSSITYSRLYFASAIGKDGSSIYYVGGQYPNTPKYENKTRYNMEAVPMDQILTFDTNSQQWRTQFTAGLSPSTRVFHTLTLMPTSGDLILFGGIEPINQTDYRQDYLYLLNTERLEWSTKSIGGNANATLLTATQIQDHSAICVGNELFVMFGTVPYKDTNDVRVLDTDSWTWKASIAGVQNPVPSATPSSDSDSSDSGISSGTIAGAVVGSIAGVAIIGAAIFLLRRRRQPRKSDQVESPYRGDLTDNMEHQKPNYLPVASPGSSYIDSGSTTQISANVDSSRGATPKFHPTTEKPDGAPHFTMTPVKPDGL